MNATANAIRELVKQCTAMRQPNRREAALLSGPVMTFPDNYSEQQHRNAMQELLSIANEIADIEKSERRTERMMQTERAIADRALAEVERLQDVIQRITRMGDTAGGGQ